MSERMSGPAAAEARAAATAEINEVQRQADEAAMGVIQGQALEDNRQFDRDQRAQERVTAKEADKQAAIQDRIDAPGLEVVDSAGKVVTDAEGNPKPTVRALNYQAEREIFGSRGETRGYVDDEGKPLTEPVLGIVDKIRGVGVADEMRKDADKMRENRRYGTTPDQRNAAADAKNTEADAYEAGQPERDQRAESYVSSIEELRDQGYELTQAKLIVDLSQEIHAGERALFDKLIAKAIGDRDPSTIGEEEARKISQEAADRVQARTVRNGNNMGMLMRMIKDEGIFSREEYDQFRYKQGDPKRGEKKQFTRYRQESINEYKNLRDHMDRVDTVEALRAKDMARERVAEAERTGRGDDEEPHEPTEPLPVPDATPRGIRGRIRDTMYRAAAYLGARTAGTREYFNDEEKGRRRRAVAVVAGAMGVAAFAALELKGLPWNSAGSHGVETVMTPPVEPHHQEAVRHAQEQLHTAASVHGGTPAQEGASHVPNGVDGGTTVPDAHPEAEVKAGQNPWTVSEHRLHELGDTRPTPEQIEQYDKHMAHLNPDIYSYYGDSSEHIPAGTELELPR